MLETRTLYDPGHRRRYVRAHETNRLMAGSPLPTRGSPQHDLCFDIDPVFGIDQTPTYDLAEPEQTRPAMVGSSLAVPHSSVTRLTGLTAGGSLCRSAETVF
jgi:hypothetical protein